MGLRVDWSTYAGLLFAVHSVHTEAVSFVSRIMAVIFLTVFISRHSFCRNVADF